MAKFDLKGMLSERSTQEMDLPEQKTVYRNPEDLIPSKDNFYSTEDTEKLKQSIKVLGILQPLLIEERNGKDYILAGHSRRKCCLELIEEGMDRFRKIPCVYKPNWRRRKQLRLVRLHIRQHQHTLSTTNRFSGSKLQMMILV